MGSSISCKRISSSSAVKSPKRRNKYIRIVHLNGHVTHLDYPATVAEVTGGSNPPPKHFLFTHAQLLSNISTPLKPDTVLEADKTYFSIPDSMFRSGDISAKDLAHMTKTLGSRAHNRHHKSKKKNLSAVMESDCCVAMEKSCKPRSWEPILDTIREKSFNQRSESELLQESV